MDILKSVYLIGLIILISGCTTNVKTSSLECSDPVLLNEYKELYRSMNIRDSWKKKSEKAAEIIMANKGKYIDVEKKTGVSRYFIASTHFMESTLDFSKNLLNGEPIDRVTQKVPKGRGPWESWEASAIEAMSEITDRTVHTQHFDPGKIACNLEKYNGWGYRNNHPEVKSPYLWSGTNHYFSGKYKEARRFFGIFGPYTPQFDPDLKSDQLGAMPLVQTLKSKGF